MPLSKLTDFNVGETCREVFGEPAEVFEALGIEPKPQQRITFSGWNGVYEKNTGNVSPTLGCHAVVNEGQGKDVELLIHFYVTTANNGWNRNDSMSQVRGNESIKAGFVANLPADVSGPTPDEVNNYLDEHVLPRFVP